eukprot:m.72602 g.72602  ORF g.72602 m.72602 type:complete len:201 (+) comp18741_c0_seq1:92-694(+)
MSQAGEKDGGMAGVKGLEAYTLPEGLTSADLIHLKGFASRLNFADPATEALESAILKELAGAKAVVWDGDAYGDTSYTKLIPRLPASTKLIAFRRLSEVESFKASWSAQGMLDRITLYAAPDAITYDKLGIIALQTTQATRVLTFGGGATVRAEFDQSLPHVKFTVFRATRPNAAGNGTEECSLVELESDGKSNLVFASL